MKFRKDEGFTLVELMVVVLIIGILIAVAVPVFNSARANAQKRTCQGSQRTVEGAYQTWYADHELNAGLAALFVDGAITDHALLTSGNDGKFLGDFIKAVPVCPSMAPTAYNLDFTAATASSPAGLSLDVLCTSVTPIHVN
ncbi:MAG: hypothetical protein CVT60_06830 [Actinobacteria bacterium HGW-Actinobacteria-10]|jgi:type IV pilus assembly protein PilA|nr:MAG: hypothetical protein CVT60_06830 [Actinobacteria bacterium HGW-Actinobacteria-10]